MEDFGLLSAEVGQFYALTYYAHAIIGFVAAAFATTALASRKGGTLHRRTGQLFIGFMTFAAASALYFVIARTPAPPVVISALAALYGMGMAILSLRARSGALRILQGVLIAIPVFVGLLYIAFIAFAIAIPEVPIAAGVLGPLAGIVFLAVARKDFQFLRDPSPSRSQRLRRHGFRMALVASEVVRAPLQSFGPPFLGEATFQIYAFGPFLLVPLFYYLAMPGWLKTPSSEDAPQTA